MAYTGMLENEPGPGESSEETPEVQGEEKIESPADDKVTGFVSMDIFPERPKIGKVCSFKVVDVAEDGQVEIEYVHNGAGAEKMPSSGPVPPWEKPSQTEADEMLN